VEVNVLLDTNILVYHVAGSPPATEFVNEVIADQSFCLSILSVIEFLGWHGHSEQKFLECKELVGLATIFPISGAAAEKTIEIRRSKRIKLADAIIAATALVNKLTLATRNLRDFRGISDLKIINPFD
jgi:toxin FitB